MLEAPGAVGAAGEPGGAVEQARGASRLHVLVKPTGAACNLDCSYCFFLEKEKLYPDSRFRMTDEVLERYIVQLIAAHDGDEVTVAWQGGEPTLMGLDFFRRAVALQERHRRPGMVFENTIQTNGTLLDDDWCAFLKAHDYLVGISLDGPAPLHDVHRVDKGGGPTFHKVMRGIRLLQKHGVRYNVLTTLNRVNADHPLEVYRFLRDEVGTEWIQFIPVVERLEAPGGGRSLHQRGDVVSERTVRPAQMGRFLNAVFDEWVRRDVGRVFIPTFEAAVRSWLRMPSSGMCVFDETCGHGLALEHNGDLYACDHYVEPDYLLGNIADRPVRDLAALERQQAFGTAKKTSLPGQCQRCEVRFACNGECPKNRFLTTADGEPGLNYLCAGYYAFFRHIDPAMRVLARLVASGRPATEVMAVMARRDAEVRGWHRTTGRNDPCPCGSGRKYKRCHGAEAVVTA